MNKEPPLRRVQVEPSKLSASERRALVSRVMARRGQLRYLHLHDADPARLKAELAEREDQLRAAGADPGWPYLRLQRWISTGY